NWGACYLTTEFHPDEVRDLLRHRRLTAKQRKDKLGQRLLVYRFLAQAGWYDEAAKELTAIAKDFPAEKERLQVARTKLQDLHTLQLYDDLQRAYKTGRHAWVQKQLAHFPATTDPKALAGVRSLR